MIKKEDGPPTGSDVKKEKAIPNPPLGKTWYGFAADKLVLAVLIVFVLALLIVLILALLILLIAKLVVVLILALIVVLVLVVLVTHIFHPLLSLLWLRGVFLYKGE